MHLAVEPEQKRFQGYYYSWELAEAKGPPSGSCAIVTNLKGEVMKRSGLMIGDIIYQVDELKVGGAFFFSNLLIHFPSSRILGGHT